MRVVWPRCGLCSGLEARLAYRQQRDEAAGEPSVQFGFAPGEAFWFDWWVFWAIIAEVKAVT